MRLKYSFLSKDDKDKTSMSFAIKNKSYDTSRVFLVIMSNLQLFYLDF